MSGAGGVGQINPLEDRRMWRRLLAQLHPDAGGDHDLFLFASALREHANSRETQPGNTTEPFLQAWQDTMDCWASRNRESLRGLVLTDMPLAAPRR